jgi:hypothetical protein
MRPLHTSPRATGMGGAEDQLRAVFATVMETWVSCVPPAVRSTAAVMGWRPSDSDRVSKGFALAGLPPARS